MSVAAPRLVRLTLGPVVVRARLLDTPTADAVWRALPLRGEAARWGDEVYFHANLGSAREPDARQVVERGALCYWCEGRAVALPFGPTPIALADECRLVGPVNVWGTVIDELAALALVESGAPIAVTRGDACSS